MLRDIYTFYILWLPILYTKCYKFFAYYEGGDGKHVLCFDFERSTSGQKKVYCSMKWTLPKTWSFVDCISRGLIISIGNEEEWLLHNLIGIRKFVN